MNFELLVAIRYLKAKRKQAAISVITVISILGVTVGVAALIIALAINAGFRIDLQRKLLGAQPHIALQTKDGTGIPDYINLTKQIEQMDGVVAAAPSVYQTVLLIGARRNQGVFLKGIIPESETRMSALGKNIVRGDLRNFTDDSIVIGQELAEALGVEVGEDIKVVSATMTTTPEGPRPRQNTLTLVAIFSSGLYDLDNSWVYVPLARAQRLMGIGPDVVSTIDVKVRDEDLDRAPQIAETLKNKLGNPHLDSTNWIELNRSIFEELNLERLVMSLTIGLIVVVAALNIVAMLTMMVLEKTRDIAILLSMGATGRQIRKIFIWQGVLIGVVGTFFGVIFGNLISFLADKYHVVHMSPEFFSIAYVPFRTSLLDSVIIAASAILISFLATLYPSAAAAKMQPVEALRYE